jgi:tRNA 2-thiouridine synthesizing protein A
LSQSVTIDARGHRCPIPTLRLRRALEDAADGAEVRLLADDPMARIDVPLFVREAGYELVEMSADGAPLSFLVRKHASALRAAAPGPA